jgi:hypothetical protein
LTVARKKKVQSDQVSAIEALLAALLSATDQQQGGFQSPWMVPVGQESPLSGLEGQYTPETIAALREALLAQYDPAYYNSAASAMFGYPAMSADYRQLLADAEAEAARQDAFNRSAGSTDAAMADAYLGERTIGLGGPRKSARSRAGDRVPLPPLSDLQGSTVGRLPTGSLDWMFPATNPLPSQFGGQTGVQDWAGRLVAIQQALDGAARQARAQQLFGQGEPNPPLFQQLMGLSQDPGVSSAVALAGGPTPSRPVGGRGVGADNGLGAALGANVPAGNEQVMLEAIRRLMAGGSVGSPAAVEALQGRMPNERSVERAPFVGDLVDWSQDTVFSPNTPPPPPRMALPPSMTADGRTVATDSGNRRRQALPPSMTADGRTVAGNYGVRGRQALPPSMTADGRSGVPARPLSWRDVLPSWMSGNGSKAAGGKSRANSTAPSSGPPSNTDPIAEIFGDPITIASNFARDAADAAGTLAGSTTSTSLPSADELARRRAASAALGAAYRRQMAALVDVLSRAQTTGTQAADSALAAVRANPSPYQNIQLQMGSQMSNPLENYMKALGTSSSQADATLGLINAQNSTSNAALRQLTDNLNTINQNAQAGTVSDIERSRQAFIQTLAQQRAAEELALKNYYGSRGVRV